MMNRPETFERSVIRSSVMPSLKYSCSASPLMFMNGSTAIDGLAGTGSEPSARGALASRSGALIRNTRTGLAMFLSGRSPRSSRAISDLSRTKSRTAPEM